MPRIAKLLQIRALSLNSHFNQKHSKKSVKQLELECVAFEIGEVSLSNRALICSNFAIRGSG
jgi:hypothetical protein